jgi:cytochrome c5
MKIFKKPLFSYLFMTILTLTGAAHTQEKQLKLGKNIYVHSCAMCHVVGISGAPKAHDAADWQTRLNQAMVLMKTQKPQLEGKALEAAAMTYLIKTVKNGLGAMPKGGLCKQPNSKKPCTDQDYMASIKFMMKPKK